MSRFLIAFLTIAFVFAFAPQSMAQFGIGLGQESTGSPKGQRAVNLNSSRSNNYRKANPGNKPTAHTTVKSSKSNTSDRMGGGGGLGPPPR